MQKNSALTFRSLREASTKAKVTRQAIFYAIQKGVLKAQKKGHSWHIAEADLEEYRANKYNYENRKVNGCSLFDVEKGHFSVQQVAKILSDTLGAPYSRMRVYYLIRKGDIAPERRGQSIVLTRQQAIELLEQETAIRKLF
jgi:hypothetical protein